MSLFAIKVPFDLHPALLAFPIGAVAAVIVVLTFRGVERGLSAVWRWLRRPKSDDPAR